MTRLRKTYLNALADVYAVHPEVFPEDIDFNEFFTHELDILAKKKEKTVAAHNEFDTKLLEVLTKAGAPLSAMDVIRADEYFADLSTQKIASGMARLVRDGVVVKTKGEKGTVYALAPETDEDSAE